jgi:hypothetical protein
LLLLKLSLFSSSKQVTFVGTIPKMGIIDSSRRADKAAVVHRLFVGLWPVLNLP